MKEKQFESKVKRYLESKGSTTNKYNHYGKHREKRSRHIIAGGDYDRAVD